MKNLKHIWKKCKCFIVGMIIGLLGCLFVYGVIVSVMPRQHIKARAVIVEKDTDYYHVYDGYLNILSIDTNEAELEILEAQKEEN